MFANDTISTTSNLNPQDVYDVFGDDLLLSCIHMYDLAFKKLEKKTLEDYEEVKELV